MSWKGSSSSPDSAEKHIGVFPPQKRHIERDAVNPVARVLLAGAILASNRASPFSQLSNCLHMVELIFSHVRTAWKQALILGPGKDMDGEERYRKPIQWHRYDDLTMCNISKTLAIIQFGSVHFPPPCDININMMPIILGDIESLPQECKPYQDIIEQCARFQYSQEIGEVAYLTIHESRVDKFEPQRRGGIHTEGFLASAPKIEWYYWGEFRGTNGGIFSANTVSNSSRIWNATVPRKSSAVLGEGCDIEHLRGVLDEVAEKFEPKAGDLCWMTDATPHESLPVQPGTYRQYFRLVTGKVSAWWEMHSTKNPLGVQPNCRVLTHSKFKDGNP